MTYIDAGFSDLPAEWELKSLSSVAEIWNTKRAPLNALERVSKKGIYPYCGANGIVDHIDEYRFDGEYVLIAEDGGHWGRNEQSSYIMSGKFWVNNHAHIISAISEISQNMFLSSAINYMDISPLISGDSRGKLTKSILVKLLLPIPPLDEQQRIIKVLTTVQNAIALQERLIVLTSELKRALMHKLFSEGLRREKQKQTDIGLVPESWGIMELGKAVEYIDYGFSAPIPKILPKNGVKIVSTADINKSGKLLYGQIRQIDAPAKTVEQLSLKDGDVLFNWRNSPELIGKTTVFEEQDEPHIFASFILRVRCDEKQYHNYFLKYLLNHFREEGIFVRLSRRAVNQANYNRNELASLKIPVPKYNEQTEMAETIGVVESNLKIYENKRNLLQELFHTLLHQLMTAQIRVNDMEL
ncbi:restriction endonuclease subunit S [Chloroflexota bacterium]